MLGDGPCSAVSALSLRLRQFSQANPQLLLAQVNSQFTIGRITTQAQKFHHVAASLPPEQLSSSEEIGDRKPTQLLRRLQRLLGDKAATFDQASLREFFLQRLPSPVRLVLVPAQGLSFEKLAELADSVMDVSYSTISLGAVPQPPTPPSSLPSRVDLQSLRDDFHAQITCLSDQIVALSTSHSL
ncbi:uncharacterized protein LOC144109534 [Amblyomma americanum]